MLSNAAVNMTVNKETN